MNTISYLEPGLFDGVRRRDWPFGDLEPAAYDMIIADPPWSFATYSESGKSKSPDRHYSCMSIDDIAALPVADLAARDCLLWMWATAPMLHMQIRVMESWGFQFKTSGVWVKLTNTGKVCFGTGYVLRNAHEPFLIGSRGNPRTTRGTRSVINAERREHSRKPDLAYLEAERLMPTARRCELFARESRPGWDTWGNEAGKFDEQCGDMDRGLLVGSE